MVSAMIRDNFDLLVIVVQPDDESGDYLGFGSHVSLGLNGADLGELVEFEVLRDLLDGSAI